METLRFVSPSADLREAAEEYRQEHRNHGENELHGSALLDRIEDYPKWLAQCEKNADEETASPDWVPASTFFVIRENDGRIVGMADIRHRLNRFLRTYGGHIGYGVRPSERRKGYAVRILEMALAAARELGLSRVMLSCYADNPASRRTIQKCGGKLERTFVYIDQRTVEAYWIDL